MAKFFPHLGCYFRCIHLKWSVTQEHKFCYALPAPQPLEYIPVSYCRPMDILKLNSIGTYYILDKYTFLILMVFMLTESRPTQMSVLSYKTGVRWEIQNSITEVTFPSRTGCRGGGVTSESNTHCAADGNRCRDLRWCINTAYETSRQGSDLTATLEFPPLNWTDVRTASLAPFIEGGMSFFNSFS